MPKGACLAIAAGLLRRQVNYLPETVTACYFCEVVKNSHIQDFGWLSNWNRLIGFCFQLRISSPAYWHSSLDGGLTRKRRSLSCP